MLHISKSTLLSDCHWAKGIKCFKAAGTTTHQSSQTTPEEPWCGWRITLETTDLFLPSSDSLFRIPKKIIWVFQKKMLTVSFVKAEGNSLNAALLLPYGTVWSNPSTDIVVHFMGMKYNDRKPSVWKFNYFDLNLKIESSDFGPGRDIYCCDYITPLCRATWRRIFQERARRREKFWKGERKRTE